MKVLLVDDDDLLRNFLKKVLTKAGVAVVEASNGKDALGLSQDVDVLVTDIVMDGIDGLCLAESVQTYRPGLPVLFISGRPIHFESERRRYSRCAFLPKPFPPNELIKTLTSLSELPS
jgi:DNA-binding response OmpR family regulator